MKKEIRNSEDKKENSEEKIEDPEEKIKERLRAIGYI